MVKGTMQLSIGAALYALLLLLCVSCSDDETSPVVSDEANSNTVTIGLKVRATYGYDEDGEYETGSEYENYLNIADGDYRIYFFTNNPVNDGNDIFIAKFTPDDVVPVEGSSYTEYSVLGEVPESLLDYDTFKVVMLANWGINNYPDDDLTASTTIEDICSPTDKSWGIFSHKENFVLDKTNLIPFYGVNTYSDVTFKANQATILDDPLTLLRAMAKVEVLFDSSVEEGTVFTDVRVFHYNDKGYCAPDKAYTKTSYDHNYTYDDDFAEDIHLVGTKYEGETATIQYDGFNDRDEDGNPIDRSLTFQPNDDRTMWYAYLPEYDNTTDADDFAYIEVKFTYRGLEEDPYRIYFAKYEDGETTNAFDDRYDIRRNNLYRFTVTLDEYLRVHVNKWEDLWDNDFNFGDDDSSEQD